MTELNQIAGNTQSLRVNVEHGVGELSQAEEINRKLQILKKRLTAVEGSVVTAVRICWQRWIT